MALVHGTAEDCVQVSQDDANQASMWHACDSSHQHGGGGRRFEEINEHYQSNLSHL
jgi:hypothetical protein